MLYHVVRTSIPVLTVFLLVGCSGSKEVIDRQQEEIAALRIENEDLRNRLNGEGSTRPTGVVTEVGETITVLLTDLYFESGSATLTPTGVARLAQVADVIRASYPHRILRIEGHTDSNPIGPALKATYPSNWELSAARAAAVVRHFQWTHKMEPSRFEVVGFGEHAPVTSNSTEAGRKENRRVRIAVFPE